MRLYLDNCSFNRPFDEQDQFKIRLETECFLRESFDYTKWRGSLVKKFEEMSVEEVSKLAMQGYVPDSTINRTFMFIIISQGISPPLAAF
jgi:hypothetical protein